MLDCSGERKEAVDSFIHLLFRLVKVCLELSI